MPIVHHTAADDDTTANASQNVFNSLSKEEQEAAISAAHEEAIATNEEVNRLFAKWEREDAIKRDEEHFAELRRREAEVKNNRIFEELRQKLTGTYGPYLEMLAQVEGFAVVVGKDNKCGVIDKAGTLRIPCAYDSIGEFNEGRFVATHATIFVPHRSENGRMRPTAFVPHGHLDPYGNEITPFKYHQVRRFSEWCAAVKTETGWWFVGLNGKEIGPCVYDAVDDFNGLEGGRAKVKLGGAEFYIDRNGRPCGRL